MLLNWGPERRSGASPLLDERAKSESLWQKKDWGKKVIVSIAASEAFLTWRRRRNRNARPNLLRVCCRADGSNLIKAPLGHSATWHTKWSTFGAEIVTHGRAIPTITQKQAPRAPPPRACSFLLSSTVQTLAACLTICQRPRQTTRCHRCNW